MTTRAGKTPPEGASTGQSPTKRVGSFERFLDAVAERSGWKASEKDVSREWPSTMEVRNGNDGA